LNNLFEVKILLYTVSKNVSVYPVICYFWIRLTIDTQR